MVSVDEVPEEGTGGGEWLLLRLVNLSTYKRCKAALHAVDERKGVSQELIDVCFGRCEPRFDSRPFSDHVMRPPLPFPCSLNLTLLPVAPRRSCLFATLHH
jgi:hypothetical protein